MNKWTSFLRDDSNRVVGAPRNRYRKTRGGGCRLCTLVCPTPTVVARSYQNLRSCVVTRVTNFLERRFDAQAASFYARLIAHGYDPDAHIDVLPQYRIIYVCVPKCGSTTVKRIL